MNLSLTDFFTHLLSEKNFYAHYLNYLQRIEAPGIGTMAVGIYNYRMALFYDPDFIRRATLRLGVFGTEHEVIHVILNHIGRYLRLLAQVTDPEERRIAQAVMNIAVDCAANSLLRRNRKNFDKIEADFRDLIQAKNPDAPLPKDAGMVLPEKYDLPDGHSFEFYQRELMKQVKAMPKDKLDAFLRAAEDALGESHNRWKICGPDGEEADVDTASAQELESLADQINAQTKSLLKKVVADHKREHGTIPAEIVEVVNSALADPIIPWWDVFTTRISATKRSKPDRGISRPNRPLLGMAEEDPMIMPAIGRTRDPRYRVFFYVDTSGSMSTESLYIAISELNHMLRADDDLEVRYMQGDCFTHSDEVYRSGDTIPCDVKGRGGTDFNEYFRYMGQYFGNDETEPDLIIVYTDGYAPKVERQNRLPYETPLIWLLTKEHATSHIDGYGEAIVCDPMHNQERKKDRAA